MALCGHHASCDARARHTGSYSSWLMKVKGDGARARWMSSSSKRYFTIDYDSELFYYSHTEDRKKISNPIRFKEILDATQLPRPSHSPFNGLSSRTASKKKDTKEFSFGFVVQTPGRNYELYTMTYLDAQNWVDGLIAGRDIANGINSENRHVEPYDTDPFSNYLASSSKTPIQNSSRESSRSTVSTTADGGSNSGHTSEQDLSRYNGPTTTSVSGPPPGPQPPTNNLSGGYGIQAPPVTLNYGDPFSGGSAPSSGYGGLGVGNMQNAPPISQPKPPPVASGGSSGLHFSPAPTVPARTLLQSPEISMMPPTGGGQEVDPFAALDALEELAGPLQTSNVETAPRQNQNIQGALLRQACNIVTNKSKPSAEANEVLQQLKSNLAVDDGQVLICGSSYMRQRPLAQQQPLAPLSPAVQAFTEPPPAFAQVQHQPLQQQVLLQQAPQQQPLQHQIIQHQFVQQCGQQQAVQQQQPTQAVSAMTYHNPSAESWDSDDDESPSTGLIKSVAPAPLAPAPLQQSPATKTPPLVNAWTTSASAHIAVAPPVKQVDPLASGWDSDDGVPIKRQAVPPPLHHQQVTSAVDGLSDNDWDEDDTTPLKPLAKATRAKPKSLVVRDPCGAPIQPTEAFVMASRPPANVVENHKSGSGDDLDDLVGEVLAVSSYSAPTRNNSSHSLVPGFHCTGCDFQVLRIDNYVWDSGVEYMFFRNNYPNVQKMRPQLVPRKGCCAYCCQCSWKSAEIPAPLEDVAAGLRWRKIA